MVEIAMTDLSSTVTSTATSTSTAASTTHLPTPGQRAAEAAAKPADNTPSLATSFADAPPHHRVPARTERASSFRTAYQALRRSSGSRRACTKPVDDESTAASSPKAMMPHWQQVSCAGGVGMGHDPFPPACSAAPAATPAPAAALVHTTRHDDLAGGGGSSSLAPDPFPIGTTRHNGFEGGASGLTASSCGLGPDPFPSESEGAVGSSRSKAIAPGTKESVALKGDAEEETKKEPASDAEALDKAAALAFEPDSDEEKKDGSDILHI